MSQDDPFITLPAAAPSSPLVLTCEHASNTLRGLYSASARDEEILAMHWGWDPGAEPLTREIAAHFGAPAVCSRFSRLLIDPNRKRENAELVRRVAEGHELSFNVGLGERDIARRWDKLHAPYHAAVDRMMRARLASSPAPFLLFSVHTFTPLYMGERREVEVGVLFDDHEDFALGLVERLGARGFRSGANVPYSGMNGMMYAPSRHGRAHGVPYLELEVRQDLLQTPAQVAGVARRFIEAFEPALEAFLSER